MASGFDYNSYLIYNPEGKIKQLDYIKRTTELGNTSIALCNNKAGVLLAHVPPRSKMAERQNKVFKIDERTIFTFSGITNDGLSIVEYLKTSSLVQDVIKDRSIHFLDVFDDLCLDASNRTLIDGSRLYGVGGILMMDYEGVKIVEFEPAGYVREVIGVSLGNRAQSCRTVLEDSSYSESSVEELIKLGIKSLQNAHPDPEEQTLKKEDVLIYVLEKDKGFKQVSADEYMN